MKGKRIMKKLLSLLLVFLMIFSITACGVADNSSHRSSRRTNRDHEEEEEEDEDEDEKEWGSGKTREDDAAEEDGLNADEVAITNDVHAAYYDLFVNKIPQGEDIPFISIDCDRSGETNYSYRKYTISIEEDGLVNPYRGLKNIYYWALFDPVLMNGHYDGHNQYDQAQWDMLEMFDCNNYRTLKSNVDPEMMIKFDKLLMYLTFVNYHCDIETEEDEFGSIVHAKITNTDLVKLIYEELENTYAMVQEDNQQASAERINNSFDHLGTFFENEEENYSHVDHYNGFYHPETNSVVYYPSYGNSYVTGWNLAKLTGGLIFEQAKYQLNQKYWQELSGDGVLYYYTIANAINRLAEGDYDTVQTELSFYAEVDSSGTAYLPFDFRDGNYSLVLADENWDSMMDVLKIKGLTRSGCSVDGRVKSSLMTWTNSYDYGGMVYCAIMGWRGCVVNGMEQTEYSSRMGYTGSVAEVAESAEALVPDKLYTGRDVQADYFYGEKWEYGKTKSDNSDAYDLVQVFADPQNLVLSAQKGLPTYVDDDGIVYVIRNNEATIVKFVGDSKNLGGEYIFPSTVNGYPVTVISSLILKTGEVGMYNGVFSYMPFETLIIPEGYRTIGVAAFSECPNLNKVILPTTLKTIEKNGFSHNPSLETVEMYDGLEYIGINAFGADSALKSLTVPRSVNFIDEGAFGFCTNLHLQIWKMTEISNQWGDTIREVPEVNYYD